MPRLNPIDPAHAHGVARELLDDIRRTFGMAPNILRAMANSPAALQAYLGFRSALGGASLGCQAVRRTGSAALNLAYVACGRLDAHWAFEINPWDSAAGVLLVQESGGVATSVLGDNYDLSSGDYLVTATAQLHRTLQPMMISSSQ